MLGNKADRKRVLKWAIRGAILLGTLGFSFGVFICLVHKLAIPPLFITELGMIIGACLGALIALTRTEKRVFPSLVGLVSSSLACVFFSFDWRSSLVLVLGISAGVWVFADTEEKDDRVWKRVS